MIHLYRKLKFKLCFQILPGLLGTCSIHALAKSILDGFMRRIFVPGKAVDFNQDVVIQVLNNEHKVNTVANESGCGFGDVLLWFVFIRDKHILHLNSH